MSWETVISVAGRVGVLIGILQLMRNRRTVTVAPPQAPVVPATPSPEPELSRTSSRMLSYEPVYGISVLRGSSRHRRPKALCGNCRRMRDGSGTKSTETQLLSSPEDRAAGTRSADDGARSRHAGTPRPD